MVLKAGFESKSYEDTWQADKRRKTALMADNNRIYGRGSQSEIATRF
jgi:hypothetical protein